MDCVHRAAETLAQDREILDRAERLMAEGDPRFREPVDAALGMAREVYLRDCGCLRAGEVYRRAQAADRTWWHHAGE